MILARAPNGAADGQNSERHIRLLAAASQTYCYAKRVLALQITLAVFGGLAFATAVAHSSHWEVWAAFYSFFVALLDALVLEKVQSDLRCQGAQIQEKFDCAVLGLPWRWALVGDPPDQEVIVERGRVYIRRYGDKSLLNWYAPVAFELPTSLARLICQRANALWDAQLRKRYRTALTALLCLPGIPALIVGIRSGMTLEAFVLGFLAPMTPATIWGVREISKQETAVVELARLRTHIESQWEPALRGRLAGSALDETAIEIQNQIFVLRRNNPLIFNWIYKAYRERQQRTMVQVAEELVAEASSAEAGEAR